MSLRRKRRHIRQHHRPQDPPRERDRVPTGDEHAGDEAWLRSSWAQATPRELEAGYGTAPWAQRDARRDFDEPQHQLPRSQSVGLQETAKVEHLAYSRRQAAEALGVSISTIDRHIVPSINTVKTPWGQRLIPVAELERFLRNHLVPANRRPARRAAGRPQALPATVVERIRLEYARGRGLSEIARVLTAEGVPTAHDGRKWWPSTVRFVLIRSSPHTLTEAAEDG